MKRKIMAGFLVLAMSLSMLPATALAVDQLETGKLGVASLNNPTGDIANKGTPTGKADIVYYGGVPWYVLDINNDVNTTNDDTTDTGILLLSQYAFGYGTQWNAYPTRLEDAYLLSDIRGYLSGMRGATNYSSANQFSPFRLASAHSNITPTQSNYSYYWAQNTVIDETPQDGVIYYTENDDVYTRTDVTTSFDEGTIYYTFSKPTQWSGNASDYYAGYSVTALNSYDNNTANSSRTQLAGLSTGTRSFASDLGLSPVEKAAILNTTKGKSLVSTYYNGELNNDTFFLLDADEAVNSQYGLSTNALIACYYGKPSVAAKYYLRSYTRDYKITYSVRTAGTLTCGWGDNSEVPTSSIRPAFNFKGDAVRFISAYDTTTRGKGGVGGGFRPLYDDSTYQFKLTLKDDTNLDGVTCDLLKKNYDGSYTLKYSGRDKGTNAAAIVMDNNNNVYGYVNLGTDASGVAEFTLPEDIELGDTYKLYIFEENCSVEAEGTDYASTPVLCDTVSTLISIEVTAAESEPSSIVYTAATDLFSTDDIIVTAAYSNNVTLQLDTDDYTVTMPDTYNNETGFHFAIPVEESEPQTLTITAKEGTDITDTIAVTVNGIAQAAPELNLAQDAATKLWSITRLTDKMEYHVGNSGDWTTCPNGSLEVTSGEETTYQVRLKATGDYKAGDIATVVVPAQTATTYTVAITTNKDGAVWAGESRKVDLIGEIYKYYDYQGAAIVMPDTYSIYAENVDGEMVDTTKDVTVTDASTTATVDYVTVTFNRNVAGTEAMQSVIVKDVGYTPAAETKDVTDLALTKGLSFVKWTKGDTDANASIAESADATYLANYTATAAAVTGKDAVNLSVKDIYDGETLLTPDAVTLNVAGTTMEGAWTVTSNIGNTATQDTDYTYAATFTAPAGYTFGSEVASDGWTISGDGKTVTRTFDAIKAGYPVTVSGITVGETVTYEVGNLTVTRPVTNNTAIIAVPNETGDTLVLTTTDGAKYSATVTGSALVLGDTLPQAAPVITMEPTGDGVALETTAITLTFDQPVTKNANSQAIVRVYSSKPSGSYSSVPLSSYTMTLSAATGSGTEYKLPLSGFSSSGTKLKLEKGLYYELSLSAEAFTAEKGLNKTPTAAFTSYFRCAQGSGYSYLISTPANGTLQGTDEAGNVYQSGTTMRVIEYGTTMTFTAAANSGYGLSYFRLVWDKTSYDLAKGVALPEAISDWVTLSDTGTTLTVKAPEEKTDGFENFRLEAIFAPKSGGTSTGGGGGGGGGSQPTTPVTPVDPVDPIPSDLPFTDVPSTEWYVDAVTYVYENGLMNGTSDTTFAPDGTTTRAMIWTVLGRLAGETIEGADWAEDARAWAMAAGVSDGTAPNAPVTREQLVTMLYRFVDTPEGTADLSKFADGSTVSDYAQPAMAWAVSIGLLQGDDLGCLNPTATATRAEVATILMRFCEAS